MGETSKVDFHISGINVGAGETKEIYLKVSESYLSGSIQIPITVIRGRKPGPTGYVTACIHGDEINGADIVRRLIFDLDHEELSGTLIVVPVANIQGFLTQSRYLPYNRDLNRFFPGKRIGNNAERVAWRLFNEVVLKSDFGIDLHTAAAGRVNLPHIRGDMKHPQVRRLSLAFGASIIVDQIGTHGALRRVATEAGVPTIVFEAGETSKFSRKVSYAGLHGVLNVLSEMKMWPRTQFKEPPYQVIVKDSDWVRAEKGGIIDLGVRPGDLVYKGDVIGSIVNPFGRTVNQIRTTVTGIVIGITTAPLSIPGTGVINVAKLKKTLAAVESSLRKLGRLAKQAKRAKRAKRARLARLARRKTGMVAAALAAVFLSASGCTTVSSPALKHETAEALGGLGKFKVRADADVGRVYPVTSSALVGATASQSSGIFRGWLTGLSGAAGLLPRLDIQLGTRFTITGGGWRTGAKYQLIKKGGFSVAIMPAYGRYTARGTETYNTSTGTGDVTQTLSVWTLEGAAPVSFSFSKTFAVYSGLMYTRSSYDGVADTTAVSDTANDLGMNLGVRLNFGRIEGDVEAAMIRLYDPFEGGSRFVLFYGLSVGVLF